MSFEFLQHLNFCYLKNQLNKPNKIQKQHQIILQVCGQYILQNALIVLSYFSQSCKVGYLHRQGKRPEDNVTSKVHHAGKCQNQSQNLILISGPRHSMIPYYLSGTNYLKTWLKVTIRLLHLCPTVCQYVWYLLPPQSAYPFKFFFLSQQPLIYLATQNQKAGSHPFTPTSHRSPNPIDSAYIIAHISNSFPVSLPLLNPSFLFNYQNSFLIRPKQILPQSNLSSQSSKTNLIRALPGLSFFKMTQSSNIKSELIYNIYKSKYMILVSLLVTFSLLNHWQTPRMPKCMTT